MVAASPIHLATAADLARLPPDRRAEVINGEIVEKANPSAEHGDAQGGVIVHLRGPFHRRSGSDKPGGWWILPEVEIELAPHEVYRPDIVGWRRERVPDRPTGRPVMVRPDWVCEVLSTSNASNNLVKKLRVYHRAEVPHYWIVDPQHETLTVLRWTPDGYLTALTAGRGDRVRAEPFAAIELPVGALFGDEE
ncbi:MAG: Uma2 family endonuclease [Minicystis sp.]